MKKHLLTILTVLLCNLTASAHDFEVNGIYYDITDDTNLTVAVTYRGSYSGEYDEYSGAVTIPSTVTYNSMTYSVTSIGDKAFYVCHRLASITIPENSQLTSIGSNAFNGCSSLASITIPEGVTSIGGAAFADCHRLASITIPECVTSIGYDAFYRCSSLTAITIPENSQLTSIGSDAFYGTSWYANQPDGVVYAGKVLYEYKGTMPENTSIEVKEGTVGIADGAFYGCSSLTSITIPESVTSIGGGAFDGTSWYANQPDGVVYAGKVLYKYKGTMPENTSIEVKEGTVGIAGGAFYGCSSLTSVTIPESVTSIGASAFRDCSSLTAVHISDIAAWCNIIFSNAYSNPLYYAHNIYINGELVTQLTIPEGVTSIGYAAFYGCSSLTAITIPEGVTSIGYLAFNGCSSLAYITIPRSVTSIGKYAFNGCINLKTVVNCSDLTIDRGSSSHGCVGYYADRIFNNVDRVIDGYLFKIMNGVNHLVDYAGDETALILPEDCQGEDYVIAEYAFQGNEDIVSVEIPQTVDAIGNSAFAGCTNLVSVEMAGGVTSIGSSAFSYCSNLTAITLPEGVTSIGNYTFLDCSSLTSITIPEGVTSIGAYAFSDCAALAGIVFPKSLTAIGAYAFKGCSGIISLIVDRDVESFGYEAFEGCTAVKTLIVKGSVMPTVPSSALTTIVLYSPHPLESEEFANKVYRDATLYVPNSQTGYRYADVWENFWVIKEFYSTDKMGISLNQATATLTKEESLTLTATISPFMADVAVAWSTSDASVATVDEHGTVTALAAGTATISATAGDMQATCIVTVEKKVIAVSGITLNQTTATLTEGESLTLTATVSPDDATDKTITWATTDAAIATVADGVVTAVAPGVATITAKAGDKEATCVVTVEKKVIAVSGIALDQTAATLTEGETLTLTATVSPDDATDKTVTWSSSNESVATVDNNGVVAAVSVGTATITAQAGDKTATCMVEVAQKFITVSNITLSHTEVALTEGETLTLKATVSPDDATDKTVTWSTSDATIATVDNNGVVAAVAAGTATITAKAGDYTATCMVAVAQKFITVSNITLSHTEVALTEGETLTLKATVSPDDATDKTVTWSSSDESVATVDNNGVVAAVAAGTATITAKAGDYTATCMVAVAQKFITVSNITLSHTEVALTEGETLTLKATVSPDDATYKTVTWSSSDESVATVIDGVITALAAGTTTIIAKAGDYTATCMVAVVSKGLIANPSFEGGTYGCDNGTGHGNLQAPEGWKVTYTYADWGWKNFQLVKDGNQQDGDQYFEFWGDIYHTLDLSQELQGLPAGTYTLSAAMRTERADQVTNQHIYVKVNGKEIPSAVLEAPKGSAWNAVDAWQTLTVIFTLDAESDVVIGATSTGGAGSAGWFQIDNFRLDYSKYGEYYLYHAESKRFLARGEHWGTCATVDRYGIPFVWTAEEYSLKFIDSNVHLFETDDSNIYTDNASTGFAFEEVEGGYLLKSQKSNRYLTIVDAAFTHDIVDVTDDASAAVVWQLKSKAEHDAIVAGYVEENYMNVIKAAGLTATAGNFVSYLATLNAEDKTSAIGTARFNGSAGDWTFTEVRHQDWQPAYGADFCELWQATGSYTQTLTGLAEGIYKVTVQGYERSGWWDLCVALGEKGYEITTATLSANGEEVNLKSWLSGKTDENNPDNTGQAIAKFNEGKYMNEVYTYVGADGTLTLTVCKPSHVGGNWIVFNNFTLTRYAEGNTGIAPSTLNPQPSTEVYDLQGRRVLNPTKGIYIVGGKKVVIK